LGQSILSTVATHTPLNSVFTWALDKTDEPNNIKSKQLVRKRKRNFLFFMAV